MSMAKVKRPDIPPPFNPYGDGGVEETVIEKKMKSKGIELIAAERQRQIEEEGYDAIHDYNEMLDNFATGAVAYALHDINPGEAKTWWCWDEKLYKPKDRLRNLVRAGALIAAAIDKMEDYKDFRRWLEEKENKI